jgi:hypothetical protein
MRVTVCLTLFGSMNGSGVPSTIRDHDSCEMYHVMPQTSTPLGTNTSTISQIIGLGIKWVSSRCRKRVYTVLSRVQCGDYIRRALDWQQDLLDPVTVTLNYSVYILQLTVHYTRAEYSHLCLHWLPVFQHRRTCSPSEPTATASLTELTELFCNSLI